MRRLRRNFGQASSEYIYETEPVCPDGPNGEKLFSTGWSQTMDGPVKYAACPDVSQIPVCEMGYAKPTLEGEELEKLVYKCPDAAEIAKDRAEAGAYLAFATHILTTGQPLGDNGGALTPQEEFGLRSMMHKDPALNAQLDALKLQLQERLDMEAEAKAANGEFVPSAASEKTAPVVITEASETVVSDGPALLPEGYVLPGAKGGCPTGYVGELYNERYVCKPVTQDENNTAALLQKIVDEQSGAPQTTKPGMVTRTTRIGQIIDCLQNAARMKAQSELWQQMAIMRAPTPKEELEESQQKLEQLQKLSEFIASGQTPGNMGCPVAPIRNLVMDMGDDAFVASVQRAIFLQEKDVKAKRSALPLGDKLTAKDKDGCSKLDLMCKYKNLSGKQKQMVLIGGILVGAFLIGRTK